MLTITETDARTILRALGTVNYEHSGLSESEITLCLKIMLAFPAFKEEYDYLYRTTIGEA